jgi:DsbC/DsbD-like thiol-disulfide interchange protein
LVIESELVAARSDGKVRPPPQPNIHGFVTSWGAQLPRVHPIIMPMVQRIVQALLWRTAGAALLAGVLTAAAAAAAEPGASDAARTDQSAVRLLSATAAVGTATELRAGLEFALRPGWKTYWRSPGDAGFPVSVDWSGSSNVAAANLSWPAPHRFTLFGLDTFGYEERVVFPIEIRPTVVGEAVTLNAKVNYLVCHDICIPYDAQLRLELPRGPATPTEHAQSIARFAAQVPGDGARHGLTLERVRLAGTPESPRLEVRARSAIAPFDEPDLIVESPQGFYVAAPTTSLSEGGMVATFALPVTVNDGAPPLGDAALVLTLVDGTRGLEQQVIAGVGFGDAVDPVPAMSSASAAEFVLTMSSSSPGSSSPWCWCSRSSPPISGAGSRFRCRDSSGALPVSAAATDWPVSSRPACSPRCWRRRVRRPSSARRSPSRWRAARPRSSPSSLRSDSVSRRHTSWLPPCPPLRGCCRGRALG